MTVRSHWATFAAEHKVARMVLFGAADLCVAVVVAVGLWLTFGVFSVFDGNPPMCSTYFGNGVDCAFDGPARVGELLIFVIVFVGLVTYHVVRGRRLRP